jgi:flagella basal body P-ring formation protein FlgA
MLARELLKGSQTRWRPLMRQFIIPALLLVSSSGARAALPALEDLDTLDARIAVYLGGTPADAGQRAQPVDRRLRMVACPEGVSFDPPAMGSIAAYCASKGWRLRVALNASTAGQLAEIVIRRGDAVELAYLGSGFDITTGATALDDGRVGGVVRVKTSTGTAPVTARVRGPGAAAIGD